MAHLILFIITLVYLWFVFIIVYHLIRFGIGVEPKQIVFIFFLGSAFFLILLFLAWSQINWPELQKLISTYVLNF